MKTNVYTRFCSLLQTGLYPSYPSICRRLHVAQDDLDELLLNELGLCGDELVEAFLQPDSISSPKASFTLCNPQENH